MSTDNRPFIRKHGDFWLIHIGRTDYCLGVYYTTLSKAADAATQIRRSHR